MKKKMSDERKTIASNFFSLTILQVANYILPLVVLPFLVRTLGSEKFGLVMLAQSLAVFLTIAVDFGFDTSGTREVSLSRNDKNRLQNVFSAILSIKFLLILLSAILLILLVEFIPRFQNDSLVFYLSFGMVVGSAIFPSWFFQGIEKMKFVSIINILAKLIFTVLIFVIIREETDYYLVPAINSLGFIISGILGLSISLRHVKIVTPKKVLMIELFAESISLFLAKLATNLYTTFNVLILGFFVGNTIVGVYASIEKLVLAIKNIYLPLYQALFPWLSKQSQEKRIQVLKKMTPLIFLVGAFVTTIIMVFAHDILNLIYSDDLINNNANIFRIFGVIAILSGLNMLFISLYLPAVKLYKVRMMIMISAGIIHLVISLLLVNIYEILGMTIAVVVTELNLLILGYFSYRKSLKISHI